tara:strand:+ start:1330 stop:1983 length:654 start_codon:yes stop_codon:yes gene_type:complete
MNELNKRILTSVMLILILLYSFINLYFLYIVILIVCFFALDEFIKIFKKIYTSNNFQISISLLISIIYLSFFSSAIILFLNSSFEVNKYKVLFLLLICISTDIGGFFFGRLIGGKKLTKISPKKTYSGLGGSLILSIAVGYLFINIQNIFVISHSKLFFLIIFFSLTSQIGDLIISLLKRKANLKDTGTILPGHGGILDRIDGILLALPLGIIIFSA